MGNTDSQRNSEGTTGFISIPALIGMKKSQDSTAEKWQTQNMIFRLFQQVRRAILQPHYSKCDPGSAVGAIPGSLLQMQILMSHPRPTALESTLNNKPIEIWVPAT